MSIWKFAKKFLQRIKKGDINNALYLTYYYVYIYVYGKLNNMNFFDSQTPQEAGLNKSESTGNFPLHPRLAYKMLSGIPQKYNLSICDIGCGSGIVLLIASKLGFKSITGIELSKIAYKIAQQNMSDLAIVKNGDAFAEDYNSYDVLCFFNPFPEPLASKFIQEKTPGSCSYILVTNWNTVDKALKENGFTILRSYQHPIYQNFNSRLYKRNDVSFA